MRYYVVNKTIIFGITLIVILGFGLDLFSQQPVYGLSCAGINMTASIADTEIIFSGVVISTEYTLNSMERKIPEFSIFSVTENFKGIYEEIVKVSVHSDWGPDFQEGLEYLVFANKNDNDILAQLCAPTNLLENVDIEFVRNLAKEYVLPPLQQIKKEVLPQNVICKNELELIFKFSDASPACVKPDTIPKLIERGWAK